MRQAGPVFSTVCRNCLPSKFKIISGGQTGSDRAALDAATVTGLETLGFVPSGRWAEDGPISRNYKGLTETKTDDPSERTRLNVQHSDGTLILSHGKLAGGSLLTWQFARSERKPCLHIDINRNTKDGAVEKILLWLRTQEIDHLNVAGPRASKDPDIYDTRQILLRVFEAIKKMRPEGLIM